MHLNLKTKEIMNSFGPGVVITALLVTTAFTIYYLIKTKHIEQMAKIESGMIDKEVKNYGIISFFIKVI